MERVLLVGSLLLNVLLLFVIFFRTALNEILVKWWTRRQERKSESRKYLMELHRVMDTFVDDYFMSLVIIASGDGGGPTAREVSNRVIDAREFLAAHELQFPSAIRRLVEQLRKEMILPGGLDDLRTGAILARSKALTQIVREIRAEVERSVASLEGQDHDGRDAAVLSERRQRRSGSSPALA